MRNHTGSSSTTATAFTPPNSISAVKLMGLGILKMPFRAPQAKEHVECMKGM